MKKKFYNLIAPLLIGVFICSVSSAGDFENMSDNCQKQECEKCSIDDDEYCVYNQCYFDRQYRALKSRLCVENSQENTIDNIYKNFKTDMEIVCSRYSEEKNRLLELIASENDCWKRQRRKVKYLKQDIREKYKDFLCDINEKLCPCQKKDFRKFKKEQRRIVKRIVKYGAIYKFPCETNSN